MDDQNKFVYVISDSNSTQIIKVKENIVETLKSSSYNNQNLWIRTNNFCIPIKIESNYFINYPDLVHSGKIKDYEMAFPSIQVFHNLSHETKVLYILLKIPSQDKFEIKVPICILPNEEDLNVSYLIQKTSKQIDIPITIKEISIGSKKVEESSTIKNLFNPNSDNIIAICEISDEILNDLINSRNSILSNIKNEERMFVSDLDKLINFWEPQIEGLDIFLEESDDPFPKIKQLFELHSNLSKALESHFEGYKTEYGIIFLYFSQLFRNSLKYLLNIPDYVLSVQNSLIFDETSEKLHELSSQCKNVSFIDYLKKPQYHYELYKKVLSELQLVTPEWHPDNAYLPYAITEITKIVNQVESNDDEGLNIDDENDIENIIGNEQDDEQDDVSDDDIQLLTEETNNFEVSTEASQKKQMADLSKVIQNISKDQNDVSLRRKSFTPPPGRRLSYDIKSEKDSTPQSLKKMLDFGDTENVEKLMSLINSSDDEESILNKIDEICSPRNKGRRYIDVDYNTIEPQPDVKDEFPKKGANSMDKISISNSDLNFLNGQANKKGDIKERNSSLIEQSNELKSLSNTKFVNHTESTDEIPVKLSDLKPISFRTNRPFNYRNFFNSDKEYSSDLDMYDSQNSTTATNTDNSGKGKGKNSPRKGDSLFNRYYGDSTYSEVYLHLNHTRVVPKETPEEPRSIFASPKRRSLNIGYYDLSKRPKEIYSPEEQARRMNQFASDLDIEKDVKYINESERKHINSPKNEQKKPFKAGKLNSAQTKKEKHHRHKRRNSFKYENLVKKLNLNSNNSHKSNHKNRLSIGKMSAGKTNKSSPGTINIRAHENNEDSDSDNTQLIQNISFEHDDDKSQSKDNFEDEEYDNISTKDKNNSDIPQTISFPFQIDSSIKIGNK